MALFRRKRPRVQPIPGGDEWILIPFRYGEAARISLHTVGMRPEVPAEIRYWIAQWLHSYNTRLSAYMRETYGEGIFPILDQITKEVAPEPVPDKPEAVDLPPWDRWEEQFGEEENNGSA